MVLSMSAFAFDAEPQTPEKYVVSPVITAIHQELAVALQHRVDELAEVN
jgi:hypothetical protein